MYDNPALALDERVAPYGVGLYRVHVTSGSCDQTIWVRLTGRSPFATVTGAVGSVAVVAGVGAARGSASSRAVRRRRGIVLGALGGAVGGFGALLLSQQFGWIGITPLEVVTWVVVPAIGGAAVTDDERHDLGRREHGSRGAGAGAGARAPAPPPPPPAPPPPSPPPPVDRAARPRRRAPEPPPVAAEPPPVRAEPPPATANGGAGAAAGAEADPPRESYARMEAPDAVVAEDDFQLVVGLSKEPVAGVLNPEIVRPESSVGPYTLVVQVVADGFHLVDGGEWRRELPVTAAAPYPSVTYTLRADRAARCRCLVASDPGAVLDRRPDGRRRHPHDRDRRAHRTARYRRARRGTGRERHRDRTAEGRAGSHGAHHLQRSGVRRSAAVDLRDDARHRPPDRPRS